MQSIHLAEAPASHPSVCPHWMAHKGRGGHSDALSEGGGSIAIPRPFLADLVRFACPGLHILDFPDCALEMGAQDAPSQCLSESRSEHIG